ncbi:RNA polymerase sigma factor [Fulvivirga sediminis]|uniref:Sigma-70 family RNA polymerase sigma factor n=1 Tax=Fulvivirga sediminis TaxID=2803949 RepID=A0A937FA16_9BACT|nr:sigma-70 family RNA polymerase sigma factor [Fulvivirga sediminis]MBL3658006.1 sigma-70 family RNA polymerase sigma factor [Fulvivirga sediminis]
MSLEIFKNKVLPVKNKLYRFALGFIKNEDEAKDIVQEVFIKIWDKKEDLLAIENIEAWCMRVTRNLSLDKLKSKHKKYTDSLNEEFDKSDDKNQTPYRSTEISDTMSMINLFIESLPDKQRQIIKLRDIEGYSYKEISEMVGVDMNQVKVNLFRARKAIKENLLNINAYGLR